MEHDAGVGWRELADAVVLLVVGVEVKPQLAERVPTSRRIGGPGVSGSPSRSFFCRVYPGSFEKSNPARPGFA